MSVSDADVAEWEARGYTQTKSATPADIQAPEKDRPQPSGAKVPEIKEGTSGSWVDSLYQKYFDRPASDEERAVWSKAAPPELESFLKEEADFYGYISKERAKIKSDALANAFAIIDNDMNLTPEMKSMAKEVVRAYKGGLVADAKEILDTFQEVKQNTIDPYYRNLYDVAISELDRSVRVAEEERATELEKEGVAADEAISTKKADLERAGLTRGGEGVEQLGTGGTAAPKDILPFGGYREGAVPRSNRLIATTSQQRHEERLRKLGTAGEKLLGSGVGIPGIVPGYDPIGGIIGSLTEKKVGEEATTLTQIAENAEKKKSLLTNIQPKLK